MEPGTNKNKNIVNVYYGYECSCCKNGICYQWVYVVRYLRSITLKYDTNKTTFISYCEKFGLSVNIEFLEIFSICKIELKYRIVMTKTQNYRKKIIILPIILHKKPIFNLLFTLLLPLYKFSLTSRYSLAPI